MCDSIYAKRPEQAQPQRQKVTAGGRVTLGVTANETGTSFGDDEPFLVESAVTVAQLWECAKHPDLRTLER